MQEKDLYCATDPHSNNNYLAIIDRSGHRVFEKRLKNDMRGTLGDSWGHTFFFRIQPAVSTSCRR